MSCIRIAFLLLLILTAPAFGAPEAGNDFVLVVNRENAVTTLAPEAVKRIFLGKKQQWEDGSTITVIVNNNPLIHEGFTRAMLGKSPSQLLAYWKKMLFSGRGILPLFADDDAAALNAVAHRKNAISYVVRANLDSRVRQVAISQPL